MHMPRAAQSRRYSAEPSRSGTVSEYARIAIAVHSAASVSGCSFNLKYSTENRAVSRLPSAAIALRYSSLGASPRFFK